MKKSPLMNIHEMMEFLQKSRGTEKIDNQLLSEASIRYQEMIGPYLMEDSIYLSLEIALLGGRISKSETMRFYSSCFWRLNKGLTFITTPKEPIKLLRTAT